MSVPTVGDLAQRFQLRHQVAALKADSTRLGRELATGRTAQAETRFGGDHAAITAVEGALGRLGAYQTATAELRVVVEVQQRVLERLHLDTAALAGQLGQAIHTMTPAVLATVRGVAEQSWQAAVDALNTRGAGQALFAGAASEGGALASASTMLAAVREHVAGATTEAEVEGLVLAWFHDPEGGFEAQGYLGTEAATVARAVAPGASVRIDTTAADPRVRDLLAGLALAALATDEAHDPTGHSGALLARAQARLEGTQAGTLGLMAEVGVAQERIETARARNSAEIAAMEEARIELLGADPYETALRLEEARARIETMFAVTARLSRLTLADFLR